MGERIQVQVLLLTGDYAELVTPWHTAQAPLRLPAAGIARDADLPVDELPGRWLTATGTKDTLHSFRLVHDPRREPDG
jgi:hypothetical protein